MTAAAPSLTLPRFVQRGRAEVLSHPQWNPDGTAASVTAGTYTLLDEGGEVVVTGAVTVVSGVPTFELAADFAADYDLPLPYAWRERWELTGVSGTSLDLTFEQPVYVQRVAPAMAITVEHLYGLQGSWRRTLPGSTIDPAEKIRIAWEEMLGRLLGDGHLPGQVLNWWALSVVHKYWAASLVCREFMADVADSSRWAKLADEYWKRSQTEYEDHFKIQSDLDDDGVADKPGVLDSPEPQLFLTDVPSTCYDWRFR